MTRRSRLPKGEIIGRRTLTFNVLVVEAGPEDPGIWVAHCLELDIFGEGGNIVAALRSVGTAIDEIVCDDMNRGIDPFARTAPEADWALLKRVQGSSAPIAIDLDTWKQPEGLRLLAATTEREYLTLQVQVRVRVQGQVPRVSTPGKWRFPAAWPSLGALQ